MAWDFEADPEFAETLSWTRNFIDTEVIPLEPLLAEISPADWQPVKRLLQDKVKARGLWGMFLDPRLGGEGLGQLKLAQMSEIIGRCMVSMELFGVQAPDSGNMELLAHGATEEQKQRWLYPNLRGDISSAFALTEPFLAGADPTVIDTTAELDGEDWVINGHKWFTTNASCADIILVVAETDPAGRPHRHASILVVPAGTPGLQIVRDIPTMAHPDPEFGRRGNHAEVVFTDCRVPGDHLVGSRGGGFLLAQQRLGGGRIHHAMRTVAQVRLAFDMMCERALSRESHGKMIAEHQMVQSAVADSYAEINMLRLLVLWTAWTIDNSSTQESRTQIAACKYTAAKVLKEVAYRAIHIFGSLGVTDLTPLQAMWAGSPAMSVMDGVDEVHKVTVARNVLKEYQPHEGNWPTEYLPAKREEARKKFADAMAADPDLVKYADFMARRSGGH
jgi:acyl-CoA dehydrogenase